MVNSRKIDSGKLEIKNVKRTFVDVNGNEIVALNDASLTVNEGEFVSLVGPSGCGKSTLLRLIAGLDNPDLGEVLLDGTAILGPGYERGLVFQDPTLFPWLNVKNNVASGLIARKVYNKKQNEVQDYINLVGLTGFENSYPHQLSGGMAQRVALARALVNHPKVLLLDEPLGALDAFTRMQMQDEILRIWQERQITVVLVTHDIDEAIYMSDRIIIMTPRPGKIQEIINVEIGRPRRRNDPDFFRIRSKILELLNFAKEEQLSYYL
ncbi:ABC transporter ATP-binding protein [Acetivibrio mesophilus]|uniref:ABC transporter ATP-binding protein n=1 Tax=Acetivibrio mesophilus TaxID=2487273 RepID=A0A4Q0I6N1_9FIRM|nr:ABC transporter ATP-binding protein [Acetivibrio mesophilus]ODM27681.1 ABC transporter ATP-binding protein [Clostridium sp. Bc-iso-3]RXE58622.1 ABC transporter ATP-binding protein [Acetivibrio mesophilus]HHV30323.1 ABC transporter ATP-binding protein [Clostridium sp.]